MTRRIAGFVAPAIGAALALALAVPASAAPVSAVPHAAAAASTSVPPQGGSTYRALTPTRIADTRTGLGVTQAGRVTDTTFKVTGVGGVPASGVASVVLNLTITDATSGGWAVAYPTGSAMPATSNVNLDARYGAATPAMVVVKPGPDGRIAVHVSSAASVIADVQGYLSTDTSSATGLFTPMTPTRLMDTRTDAGRSALGPGAATNLTIAGTHGIPANATAVVLNTTATNATTGGWVTDYPTGQTSPTTSTINFLPGQTKANRSIVTLGTGGAITIQNAAGKTDAIIDITGYFTSTGAGSYYVPINSARLADSRTESIGPSLLHTQFYAGFVKSVQMTGEVDDANMLDAGTYEYVPTMSATTKPTAILGNLTAADEYGAGWETLYPNDGSAQPGTSDLNFDSSNAISNAVVTGLGTKGDVNFVVGGPGGSDLILDVSGYFALPAVLPTPAGIWQSFVEAASRPMHSTVPRRMPTTDANGVTQVAMTELNQVLGLKPDATVRIWSGETDNEDVLASPISGTVVLTGVKQIAGFADVAALKNDGTVWIAAGSVWPFAFNQVTGLTGVSEIIAGGDGYFYALLSTGRSDGFRQTRLDRTRSRD